LFSGSSSTACDHVIHIVVMSSHTSCLLVHGFHLCVRCFGQFTGTLRCHNQVHPAIVTSLSRWLGLPKKPFLLSFTLMQIQNGPSLHPCRSNRPFVSFFPSSFFVNFWRMIFRQKSLLPKPQNICMSNLAQGRAILRRGACLRFFDVTQHFLAPSGMSRHGSIVLEH